MNIQGWMGFVAVGWMLVVVGVVLLLANPVPGIVVLLIGGAHLGVGRWLRSRAESRVN